MEMTTWWWIFAFISLKTRAKSGLPSTLFFCQTIVGFCAYSHGHCELDGCGPFVILLDYFEDGKHGGLVENKIVSTVQSIDIHFCSYLHFTDFRICRNPNSTFFIRKCRQNTHMTHRTRSLLVDLQSISDVDEIQSKLMRERHKICRWCRSREFWCGQILSFDEPLGAKNNDTTQTYWNKSKF